jgi:hypothetical protein
VLDEGGDMPEVDGPKIVEGLLLRTVSELCMPPHLQRCVSRLRADVDVGVGVGVGVAYG